MHSPPPSYLPPVVDDSIAVTLALGFQYLRVDRYVKFSALAMCKEVPNLGQQCIDQASDSKHFQISQMDRIYSGAELGIVVAAGDNANYGLPGVSSRLRQKQAKASLPSQGISLLQVYPTTNKKLAVSVWASRGWTLQEGYLSRRRLIFTDDQVSFLCNTMYSTESFRQDPDICIYNNMPFQNIIPSPFERGLAIAELITEYTTRRLSYSSDSLSAFLGILQSLENVGIRHLWGVPFKKTPYGEF